MNTLSAFVAVLALLQVPQDAKVRDLGDGYSRVVTPSYEIEIPTGWEVSEETRWGQRKVQPKNSGGELGVMTAPPSRQTWDEVYQTSLFFILRESKGKPTPLRLGESKSGLETASFEVLDESGFAARRYILVRGKDGRLLALSVKVPSEMADKEWSRHFDRFSRTAKFRPESR